LPRTFYLIGIRERDDWKLIRYCKRVINKYEKGTDNVICMTTTTVNCQKVVNHRVFGCTRIITSFINFVEQYWNFYNFMEEKVILSFQFGKLNDAIKHILAQRSWSHEVQSECDICKTCIYFHIKGDWKFPTYSIYPGRLVLSELTCIEYMCIVNL
jgi:hypothetical protein